MKKRRQKFLKIWTTISITLALIAELSLLKNSIKAEHLNVPHIYRFRPNRASLPLSVKTRIDQNDDQGREHMFLVMAPSINNRQPLSAYSQPSKPLENGLDEGDGDDDDGSAEYELEILDENPSRLASNGFIVPNTWRVVLGDLCQLPNLRRPTEKANSFAECMQIEKGLAETLKRNDLGFWRLRKCPPGTLFVPSAQICLPEVTIRLQHLLCSSSDSKEEEEYNSALLLNGCPPKNASEMWHTTRRMLPMPGCEDSAKSAAESKSGCKDIELLEPCPAPAMLGRLRRQYQYHQLPPCPCPPQRTNCAQTQQPQMFMDCCCVEKQIPPCLCTPVPDHLAHQQSIINPPALSQMPPQNQPHFPQNPPHLLETGSGQMYRLEITPIGQQPQTMSTHNYGPEKYGSTGGIPNSRIETMGPPPRTGPTIESIKPIPPINQPQPCPMVEPNSVQNAHYQDICSWMFDPLVADPESRAHFLQCQPAPFNLLCGRWQRMPCAPKTVFEPREQLCVWDTGGLPGSGNQIGGQTGGGQPGWQPGNVGNGMGGQMPGSPGNGLGNTAGSFIIPGRKVLECTCQCRTGGIPLGPCSPSLNCPTPAVCQTGLVTPQQPCALCCLYRNGKR